MMEIELVARFVDLIKGKFQVKDAAIGLSQIILTVGSYLTMASLIMSKPVS